MRCIRTIPLSILAALVAAILFSSSPVLAAPQLKIAVVDIQRVLTSAKEGQQAQKVYENDVKKAQEGLDKKKSDFETKKKNFEKRNCSL